MYKKSLVILMNDKLNGTDSAKQHSHYEKRFPIPAVPLCIYP